MAVPDLVNFIINFDRKFIHLTNYPSKRAYYSFFVKIEAILIDGGWMNVRAEILMSTISQIRSFFSAPKRKKLEMSIKNNQIEQGFSNLGHKDFFPL